MAQNPTNCVKPKIQAPSRQDIEKNLSLAVRSQLSGLPTNADVASKMELYSCIAKEVPLWEGKGLTLDPGGKGLSIGIPSTDLIQKYYRNDPTIKMLEKFGDITGEKLPKEIKVALQGIDTSFVFDLADQQIAKWLNRGSELVATALSATNSFTDNMPKGFGKDAMALGMTTIEMVTSNKPMTDMEILGAATSMGATMGGMIGSIFPGIGTTIGAAIGAIIGSTIGAIVGALTKPPWDKTVRAAEKQAIAAARSASLSCVEIQKRIEEVFKSQIYAMSTSWINAEMTLGYRIPLRWFDSNPGLRFEQAAMMGNTQYMQQDNPHPRAVMGKFPYPQGDFDCYSQKSVPKYGYIRYGNKQVKVYGFETKKVCNFYCPEKVLGCLYPPTSYTDYGPARVMSAFHARGFTLPVDLGCDNYTPVTDRIKKEQFPGWDSKQSAGDEATAAYNAAIARSIQDQSEQPVRDGERAVADFNVISAIISNDFSRTIALMQSQQNILMNKVALEGTGVVSTVATRFAGLRGAHEKRMRNLAFVGGAGLLAATVWKNRK